MKTILFTTSLLLSLGAAHFDLNYPPGRELADEETMSQSPCGGNNVVGERTEWPITGGAIQLDLGHDHSTVQILLGLGNDVEDFNITLRPKFNEQGPGDFCLPTVSVPADANVVDGQNATIQVSTGGDPNGGLYNCADITFRESAPSAAECKNSTGVKVLAEGESHDESHDEAKPKDNSASLTGSDWSLASVAVAAVAFALFL
ncbi:MAG: hypothetical protein M1825_002586 [Sarcosagium campestre]|nr:MAG: hypothetical protein M1825_002586 [Sarcosagium campestre]